MPDRRHVHDQLQSITTTLQYYGTRHLRAAQDDLQDQTEVLDERLKQLLDQLQATLKSSIQLLNALNPTAILRRGYAIVRHDGQLVRSSYALHTDAMIEVQLANGNFAAVVKRINRSKGVSLLMAKVKSTKPNYQVLKAELESVMAKLQAEDLDVDEALHLYERGLELIQQLESYLKTAENTVHELKTRFDKGS